MLERKEKKKRPIKEAGQAGHNREKKTRKIVKTKWTQKP
jgi:hypothetical protein